MRVSDRMTKNPKVCEPDTLLYDARDIMLEGRFRRLPVMEENKLVGVVTDRDIRSVLLPTDLPERVKERIDLLKVRRVNEIMTPDPITIDSKASLERASEILRRKKFGGLPVIDNGKLVGVISARDIMGGLIEGLGAHRESFRFTVEISRKKPDALSHFIHSVATQRAIVLSLLSDFDTERNRNIVRYTVRVARAEPEKLLPFLQKAGTVIVDVVTERFDEGL